ncbi:protein AKNAD1 [Dipodomys merriami]|uniref:protein AKNAD1 n=1 Tax=Dipodomys merriami TaxID=94247 RepID=UPI003855ABB4
MDDTDISEDTICRQQEDLPYDEDLPQMFCNDYHFTFKNDNLGASGQLILTGPNPQDKPVQNKTFQNSIMAMGWDKSTKNTVYNNYNKEKLSIMALHIPAYNSNDSKANISNILHHRLFREQILRGKGIDCETLPETSNTDSVDKAAVIRNIISRYVKKSCHKEQTSEFTGQPKPKQGGINSKKPSHYLSVIAETTSDIEEPCAARDGFHQENPHFLTEIKGTSDKEKYSRWQVPQKQLIEKASSNNGFKDGHGQVHHQHLNFSKVAPRVKIPKNNTMEKPFSIDKQVSFSPTLRTKPMALQEILEAMSRSDDVSKQHPEQPKKETEPFQQLQMEPEKHINQQHTGKEMETNLLKLTLASQKIPSSNSYIFLKISQGTQMCQKLKEQTDQLKTKVQEFSRRINQESPSDLQDRRMVPEQLQGHLEVDQDCLATTEKHPTLHEQTLKCESSAMGDFNLERKQKMERKDHRKIDCGRLSVINEKDLNQDLTPGSETRPPSFCSGPGTRLQSSKCEDGGTKIFSSPRVCSKESPKKFHYRHNTPGQNHLNQNGRGTFIQSCSLDQSKNSSPQPKWICSQRVNSKFIQDECEFTQGKKNMKTFMAYSSDLVPPSTHLHSCRASRNKALCDLNNNEETNSKMSNSALDNALKTATNLKKTTDQMIKDIAEDLAKAQTWRNRLKF